MGADPKPYRLAGVDAQGNMSIMDYKETVPLEDAMKTAIDNGIKEMRYVDRNYAQNEG